MGKISGYPTDNDVQLSDKLIGSDVADQFGAKNLQTKNYTVGDILGVSGSPTYVPYTGALGSVDLGVHGMTLTAITVNGAFTDSVASAGTLNQILSVAASGFVEWKDPAAVSGVVPYVGAVQDVDLGIYGLTLADIDIGGTLTDRNDSIGTNGQVLVSANTSGTQWTSDLTLNDLDVTGDLAMSGTVTDSGAALATQGVILKGGTAGIAEWFAPLQVLATQSYDNQNLSGIGLVDLVTFGTSVSNTDVTYAAGVLTFNTAGTYMVKYALNGVGAAGGDDAIVALIPFTATGYPDPIYSNPVKMNLIQDTPMSYVGTELIGAAAGGKWRLDMTLVNNIAATLTETTISAYSGDYSIPAASLQVFKLS